MFFFQAEDGIRDLVRSRGLGDVYKRQGQIGGHEQVDPRCSENERPGIALAQHFVNHVAQGEGCLLYTSDAADERSSVDLGGRRIIKKKKRTISNDTKALYNIQGGISVQMTNWYRGLHDVEIQST